MKALRIVEMVYSTILVLGLFFGAGYLFVKQEWFDMSLIIVIGVEGYAWALATAIRITRKDWG